MKKIQLPSLVFGSRHAHVDTSEASLYDRLKLLSDGWTPTFESLVKPHEFISHSGSIKINGLIIGSIASTAIRFSVKKSKNILIFIPLMGSGKFRCKDEEFIYREGDRAVVIPAEDFDGESTLRSSMAINIDPNRLESTARSMLGIESSTVNLIDLDRPQ